MTFGIRSLRTFVLPGTEGRGNYKGTPLIEKSVGHIRFAYSTTLLCANVAAAKPRVCEWALVWDTS